MDCGQSKINSFVIDHLLPILLGISVTLLLGTYVLDVDFTFYEPGVLVMGIIGIPMFACLIARADIVTSIVYLFFVILIAAAIKINWQDNSILSCGFGSLVSIMYHFVVAHIRNAGSAKEY